MEIILLLIGIFIGTRLSSNKPIRSGYKPKLPPPDPRLFYPPTGGSNVMKKD
jgi:hypothetical protein